MKRFMIILTMLVISSAFVYSQCVIYLKNGQKIEARSFMAPLKGDDIFYKSKDKQQLSIKKADLFVITRGKYLYKVNANGFLAGGKMFKGMPPVDQKSTCVDGAVDALTYYKSSAKFGVAIVSFLAWPVGLVTAAVVSSTKPPESKLNIPPTANKSDNTYIDCYKKEAKKKKSQEVWMGWSLGTTLGVLVEVLLLMPK